MTKRAKFRVSRIVLNTILSVRYPIFRRGVKREKKHGIGGGPGRGARGSGEGTRDENFLRKPSTGPSKNGEATD